METLLVVILIKLKLLNFDSTSFQAELFHIPYSLYITISAQFMCNLNTLLTSPKHAMSKLSTSAHIAKSRIIINRQVKLSTSVND